MRNLTWEGILGWLRPQRHSAAITITVPKALPNPARGRGRQRHRVRNLREDNPLRASQETSRWMA